MRGRADERTASVPIDEQETVIQFDRDSDVCHVYTTDTTMMTKLDKVHKRIKQDKVKRKVVAAYYEFDKKLLSFRSKRIKRELSDTERQKLAERMKKTRAKTS